MELVDGLLGIVRREPTPEPWAEGEKIPWNEPGFSARMLKEHLSQDHDAASRRFEIVDRHVAWIHNEVLGGEPTRVLDLGCGPGLYTSRLARLGHTCVGIDFGPASVSFAEAQAAKAGLSCTYRLADLREADYGEGYGLVMLIFGELNVFRPEDARSILRKAHAALVPGGHLLLEPHTFEVVESVGRGPATWCSASSGLFSDHPHIVLEENIWHAACAVATTRYFVIDATTSEVTRHASSMQAYTDGDYRCLLADCGFVDVVFYPSLTGAARSNGDGLQVIVARRIEG